MLDLRNKSILITIHSSNRIRAAQLGVSRERRVGAGRLQTVTTKIVAPERVGQDMAHMDPAMLLVIFISFFWSFEIHKYWLNNCVIFKY